MTLKSRVVDDGRDDVNPNGVDGGAPLDALLLASYSGGPLYALPTIGSVSLSLKFVSAPMTSLEARRWLATRFARLSI